MVVQKVWENARKNIDFALQTSPRTRQDASKIALGPLLGRYGFLLAKWLCLATPVCATRVHFWTALGAQEGAKTEAKDDQKAI